MQGFKSFADKTTIDLTDGMTAIVGPNGSGKSNIIEALRWVMGETSAKSLRGEKMADVIFAGTDQRKAVNIAEVTIVLDNSDHFIDSGTEEVSITRSLSRDGKSNYFINKQSARLKDITDIFTDSGLGKESFAIVSQGQVESVFNSKAKDRRGIFEEASGVLKFKERKHAAENDLNKTQENLNRIKDILYELEKQRTDLKSEKEKAELYTKLNKQLQQADVFVKTTDILTHNKALAEQTNKQKKLLDQLNDLKREEASVEKHIADLKLSKNNLQAESEQQHHELLGLVQAIERADADLKLYDEKNRQSVKEKRRIEEAVSRYLEKQANLKHKLLQLDKQIATEKANYQAKLAMQKDKAAELDGLSLSKEDMLENLRNDYIDTIQERTQLHNESSYLEKENKQLASRIEKYKQEVHSLHETFAKQENEMAAQKEEKTSLEKQLTSTLQTYRQLVNELNDKKNILNNLQVDYENYSRQYHSNKQKYDTLINMQKNYVGFYQGVQKIMQHARELQGIVGTVAELISVPEKYQTAIQLALSASSQHIIVENDAAGRAAIQYLKAHQAGRATFLPLTTMKARYVKPDIKAKLAGMNGFVAVADELVDYDAKIKVIIQNLLGHIIIADNLVHANAISQAIHRQYRVVTLEGDVVNVGGSLTGGSRHKSQSDHIFSQKNEVDRLEKVLPKLHDKYIKDQKHIEQLSQVTNDLHEKSESVRQMGEKYRQREQNLQEHIESEQTRMQELNKQIQASEFEYREAEQDFSDNTEILASNTKSISQLQLKLDDLQAEMDNLQGRFKEKESERNIVNKQLAKIQGELSEQNADLMSLKKEKAIYTTQLEELEQSLQEEKDSLQKKSKRKPAKSLSDLQTEKSTLQTKREKVENQQVHVEEKLQTHESALDKLELSIKDNRIAREDLQESLSDMNVSLSKLRTSLSQDLNYLNEMYAVSFEESKERLDQTLDYAIEKQKVKQLKTKIQSIGSVNVQAITDFKQLDQRYNFMKTQRNDLLEAQDDLFATMKQMDKEVANRFEKTFKQIQKAFAAVFPKMFGGGRAELILTEPDNMLETGVEIKAQPPGKNLQHLSLLSGGERALTAISLLFAIMHTRPIPFVILDEVEAALDDANVLRFSHYLKHFTDDDMQFIVITHRRGTMENADNLYGVVMQEKGISNIVSVRLADVDDMLDETKG